MKFGDEAETYYRERGGRKERKPQSKRKPISRPKFKCPENYDVKSTRQAVP